MSLFPSILLLFLIPCSFSIYIEEGGSYYSSSESHEYNGRHNHKPHRPPPRPSRPRCDSGWQLFERPSGAWCMKVFPGTLNQYASEAQCATQGATLSGLQNTAEINWVVSAALPVIAPHTSGGVWIGTQRRPECYGSGISATCTKTNTFYWTDKSTTGIEGMIFQAYEPNNGMSPTGNQNCALLTVAHTSTISAVSTYWSGQMDDFACNTSGTSHWPAGTLPRANRAYLCGKKARR